MGVRWQPCDFKCHFHIHKVKVSIFLACRSRTEQQAAQGAIHAVPSPLQFLLKSSGRRARQGRDTAVQTRVGPTATYTEWDASQRQAQREESVASGWHVPLAEVWQKSVSCCAAGNPGGAELRDRGFFTLFLGSGFAQTIAAYQIQQIPLE